MASLIVILDDRATNRSIYTRLAASIDAEVSVQRFGSPAAALHSFPEMNGAEFIGRLCWSKALRPKPTRAPGAPPPARVQSLDILDMVGAHP